MSALESRNPQVLTFTLRGRCCSTSVRSSSTFLYSLRGYCAIARYFERPPHHRLGDD